MSGYNLPGDLGLNCELVNFKAIIFHSTTVKKKKKVAMRVAVYNAYIWR